MKMYLYSIFDFVYSLLKRYLSSSELDKIVIENFGILENVILKKVF